MENETKTNEQTQEVPKLLDMVDRLEKANKEAKEILAQQNEIIARNLLGGQTNAGVQETKPKEESPKEYTKRIMGNKG
jgi:hypothetical protein